MKKPRPKRGSRGKAKPIPVEAKELAVLHRHSVAKWGLNACIEDKGKLVPAREWIAEKFGACDSKMLADVSRELKRLEGEPKYVSVIHAYWSEWNREGLKWGERALKMKELGFPQFTAMPITSFKSLCGRWGLEYAPAK